MNSIVGWFIESFGNELHVEPLVLDNNNEKAIKKLNSKIAGYISELHNLDGVYYLCFFHKSGKYKFIYEIITGSGKNIGVFTKSDEIVGVFHKDSEFDLDIGDYYIKVESEYMLNIFKLAIRKVE